jgi:hypothetical protein
MAAQLPFRAPTDTPIADKNGALTVDWSIHMQLTAQQLKTPANQPAPLTDSQTGQHGQIALNGGFLYAYDGTVGKWIKFAPIAF